MPTVTSFLSLALFSSLMPALLIPDAPTPVSATAPLMMMCRARTQIVSMALWRFSMQYARLVETESVLEIAQKFRPVGFFGGRETYDS